MKLFVRFAERFSQRQESDDDRDRHGSEDQIPHLVLGRSCLPRRTKADPKKSQECKWRDQKNSGQCEQSRPANLGRYRARTKSRGRQRHRCELDYSDHLIKRRHAQWADGAKNDRHDENGEEEPITETSAHAESKKEELQIRKYKADG